MSELKDKYMNKYLATVKACKTDNELKVVLYKIYYEGYNEGIDEGQESSVPDEPLRNEGYDWLYIKINQKKC